MNKVDKALADLREAIIEAINNDDFGMGQSIWDNNEITSHGVYIETDDYSIDIDSFRDGDNCIQLWTRITTEDGDSLFDYISKAIQKDQEGD